MNINDILLANLQSRLNSFNTIPAVGEVLTYNLADARFEPHGFKTIGGVSIYGVGDIAAGAPGAVYAVDYTLSNNTAFTGVTMIGGDALTAGTKVLLRGQTDTKQNGVYVSDGIGNLTRATLDYARRYFFVRKGTNWNKFYLCDNVVEPTVGTTSITFTEKDFQETLVSGSNIKTIGGSSVLGAGNLVVAGGASLGTNTFTAKAAKPITLNYSPQPIYSFDTTDYNTTGGQTIGTYSEINSGGTPTEVYTSNVISSAIGGTSVQGYGRVWMFWLNTDSSTPDNLVPWNLCRVFWNQASNVIQYQIGTVSGTAITWNTATSIPQTSGVSVIYSVAPVGGRQFVWAGSGAGLLYGSAMNTYVAGHVKVDIAGNILYNASSTWSVTTAQTVASGNMQGVQVFDVSHYYGESATTAVMLLTMTSTKYLTATFATINTNTITYRTNFTIDASLALRNTTQQSCSSLATFVRVNQNLGYVLFVRNTTISYKAIDLSKIYIGNVYQSSSVLDLLTWSAYSINASISNAGLRKSVPEFFVASSSNTADQNCRLTGVKAVIDSTNYSSSTLSTTGMGAVNSTDIQSGSNMAQAYGLKLYFQSEYKLYVAILVGGTHYVWSVTYNPTTQTYTGSAFTGAGYGYTNTNDTYSRYAYIAGRFATAEGKPTFALGLNSDPSPTSTYMLTYTYSTLTITNDLDKFKGIVQTAIAQGATGTATGRGGLVYDASYSLTPGSKYYVQTNASLGTTVNGTAVGYAVTKNHLYLYS